MKLTTKKTGTDLTICLSGDLNTLTAPELSALLDKELSGVQELILDFTECDYVSSAGLRVLLATFKKMKAANGSMFLSNVGEIFMDILSNTGLDGVIDMK